MIDVIKSGDANRGQQIARNLCNTYGVKPEDAIAQVAQNQYLTDTLRPCPSPAYITANPWAGQPYGSCASYSCGCGCN